MHGFRLLAISALGLIGCGPPPAPRVVEDEIARAGRGKAAIVQFVDYECPFCRMEEADLAALVAAHRGQVRLVRKHVPLRSHRHAKPAATLALCAEAQGAGEAAHEALMASPSLDPEALDGIARKIGLEEARRAACTGSEETAKRLAADRAAFDAAGGEGLPTVFIGRRRFVGMAPIEVLEKALGEALEDAE